MPIKLKKLYIAFIIKPNKLTIGPKKPPDLVNIVNTNDFPP